MQNICILKKIYVWKVVDQNVNRDCLKTGDWGSFTFFSSLLIYSLPFILACSSVLYIYFHLKLKAKNVRHQRKIKIHRDSKAQVLPLPHSG